MLNRVHRTTGAWHLPVFAACSQHVRNPFLYICQLESQAAASTVLSWATLPNSIRVACSTYASKCQRVFDGWIAIWRKTAPMKVQQELMRHADIRTTMNVYGKAM